MPGTAGCDGQPWWSSNGRVDPISDLRGIDRIAGSAKNPVRGIADAIRPHERADVLPDDLAFVCHLEQPAPLAFADQRVAVGQALRTADVRAEQSIRRPGTILPHRPAGARIELDHARERIVG